MFVDVHRYSKSMLGLTSQAAVVRFGLARARSRVAKPSDTRTPLLLLPSYLDGLQVELNAKESTHFDIFDEIIVERVYDLSVVSFVPTAVMDCGGHIGLFTALAACHYGAAVPITTFEPDPDNAGYVRRLIERNGLRQVNLIQAAVGTTSGSAKFFTRNTVGGSLSPTAVGVVGSFDVRIVDLPQLLRERKPDRLLLKMDVEGEELRLLPALVSMMPPTTAVFFETHTAQDGWDAIAACLSGAGFDVTMLRNRDPFRDGFASRGGRTEAVT